MILCDVYRFADPWLPEIRLAEDASGSALNVDEEVLC